MPTANLAITADNAQFIKALEESKAALQESFEQMRGAVEGFTGVFEKINVAMASFAAVLGGGKVFKEAIESSVGAATGAAQLGRELGITATQASILKVAMDENFVPMEAVSGAANKIAAAVKKNPTEFERMGVAIRDSNGNMLDSFTIMQGVNEHLASMQEGTARNVEGQRIYGKAWESIAPSIRITGEAMEEARVKAESLGLVVGKEGIAQATEYRKAMAGVHTVFDGIEKAIGDALIPVLTRLAQWFESVGPQAVQITKGAIVGLVAVYENLTAAGFTFVEAIAGAWEYVTTYIVTAINVIAEALAHPFSGNATAAWDAGMAKIEADAARHVANIKKAWADAAQTVDGVSEKMASHDTPTDVKPGKATIEDDNAGKSRTGEWQTALEEKKAAYQEAAAAQGQLLEFSRQQEIQYWQQILATTTTTLEERKQIHAKMAADELAIDKAQLEGSLAR